MKTCTKCEGIKPLSEFHLDKGARDGHSSSCKVCAIARSRAHYAHNKPAPKARKPAQPSLWARNDPAIRRKWQQKYEEAHRGELAVKRAAYQGTEESRAYQRAYAAKLRIELGDCYVRGQISIRSGLKHSEIPDALVGLKREHLRVVRLLKEEKK